MPFEIQVLVPLMTYSLPSRRADVRIACRSVPQSGSVRARPPRVSPVAKRGRKWRFCSSVPMRATMCAMMRCELMMPETDIQTRAIRSMMRA